MDFRSEIQERRSSYTSENIEFNLSSNPKQGYGTLRLANLIGILGKKPSLQLACWNLSSIDPC